MNICYKTLQQFIKEELAIEFLTTVNDSTKNEGISKDRMRQIIHEELAGHLLELTAPPSSIGAPAIKAEKSSQNRAKSGEIAVPRPKLAETEEGDEE